MSGETGKSVWMATIPLWFRYPSDRVAPSRIASSPLCWPPLMRALYASPPKGRDGESVPNPNEGIIEAIKQGSRIERKGKIAISCAHLLTGSGESAMELLLFFARGADPITVGEKAVTLESRFGPFHLSVKFPLKEMMYKGALAL